MARIWCVTVDVKTLIVCMGNEHVCDDGIGARVGRVLADLPLPSNVAVITIQKLRFELLDDLAGVDSLILVDALATGGEVGQCTVVDVTNHPSSLASGDCAHQMLVGQILELARYVACGDERRPVTIAGIEGKQFLRFGDFSEEVLAAVPRLVDLILLVVGARLQARNMVKEVCRRLTCAEQAQARSSSGVCADVLSL